MFGVRTTSWEYRVRVDRVMGKVPVIARDSPGRGISALPGRVGLPFFWGHPSRFWSGAIFFFDISAGVVLLGHGPCGVDHLGAYLVIDHHVV